LKPSWSRLRSVSSFWIFRHLKTENIFFWKKKEREKTICWLLNMFSGEGRADESPGQAGHGEAAVGAEPQSGGQAGQSGVAAEPADGPAGAAGGADQEDRPRAVPVPAVLHLVPLTSSFTIQISDQTLIWLQAKLLEYVKPVDVFRAS
jgi:hypothetical protein